MTIGALILQNRYRSRPLKQVELRPNCLLTKAPLLFVSGKKSLFYFLSYWNHLPQILAEHGYEVYHLNLPWKNSTLRQEKLDFFLRTQAQSFHLFIDPSTETELKNLISQRHYPTIQSITLVTDHQSTLIQTNNSLRPTAHPIEEIILHPTKKSSLLWKVHQAWIKSKAFPQQIVGWSGADQIHHIRNLFLERVIFLAERDITKDLHHGRHQENLLRH
ncbi:MAG: hypothetical protein BroJett040_15280 [Oligoflexia bacterium]|nr:MAG: hypothetical protein BroJett040_15280 [Oligoflexia bacterium]